MQAGTNKNCSQLHMTVLEASEEHHNAAGIVTTSNEETNRSKQIALFGSRLVPKLLGDSHEETSCKFTAQARRFRSALHS
jgi:hypothetical protein